MKISNCYFLVYLLIGSFIIISCKKDKNIETLATINTLPISNVTESSANSGGEIINDGGCDVIEKGICWSKNNNPSIDDYFIKSIDKSPFISQLTQLDDSTKYYVRAYAINNIGIAYGNELEFTTYKYDSIKIGRIYKGGIIGYIFQSNDSGYVEGEAHGLIVAPFDQGSNIDWGCWNTNLNITTYLHLGAGNQNTQNIVSACSSQNYAAKLCFDLVLNGYDDWFLPSKDELAQLCLNRFKIGNFESNFYWSSSDDGSNTNAWSQSFGSGSKYFDPKYNQCYVRAVREF